MKRLFDLLIAIPALLVALPFIAVACALVWFEDRGDPFFRAERIGRGGVPFRMLKIRSMRLGSHLLGVHSTQAGDPRLLRSARWTRALKLDELPQFWNVISGTMSVVGPRPNVPAEVAMYTTEERHLLDVRPGVTDYASIVFADLAEILAGAPDANRMYNRLVRPWKSRLGLHYVRHHGPLVDLAVVALTGLGILDKGAARRGVAWLLRRTGAAAELVDVARRTAPLEEAPPPGATVAEWDAVTTYRA